jgi:hypothetical protein
MRGWPGGSTPGGRRDHAGGPDPAPSPAGTFVKADGELLADLAVVVGHDVARVGVDAYGVDDLDVDARLLLHLPDNGVRDALAALGVSFVVEDIPQDSFGPYSPQAC